MSSNSAKPISPSGPGMPKEAAPEGAAERKQVLSFEEDRHGNAKQSKRLSLFPSGEQESAAAGSIDRGEDARHHLGMLQIGLDLAQREIVALKKRNAELIATTDFTRAVLDKAPPLLILDRDLRVVLANNSFLSHFQVARPQTESCLVYQLGNGQWDVPRLRLLLEEVLPRKSFFHDFEITHDFPG